MPNNEKSVSQLILEGLQKNYEKMIYNQMHGIGKGWTSREEMYANNKRNESCQCEGCKERRLLK